MTDHKDFEQSIRRRRLELADYEAVVEMQKACFPKMRPWSQDQFASMLRLFPAGQLCIAIGGALAASSSSLKLDFDLHSEWHDWTKISDSGFIRNHDPKEDTPNVETLVIHDVDIELLRRHRYLGTTQNWGDRRKDVYEVFYKQDGERVEV